MTTNDPRQHWKNESAVRRAKLEHVRSSLRVARQRHLQSGHDNDARQVTQLAELERLAEQALDHATEQLELTSGPKRVVIHSSREGLGQQRAQVQQRMAWRTKQYEQQIQLERERCKGMPERHVLIHLQNVLGRAEAGLKRANAVDQRILDDIAEQFAAHDAADGECQPLGAA